MRKEGFWQCKDPRLDGDGNDFCGGEGFFDGKLFFGACYTSYLISLVYCIRFCSCIVCSCLLHKEPISRSTWCKFRSKTYWNAAKRGDYGDSWWHDNLRMDRSTFTTLCSELLPHIRRKLSRFRVPVTVDEQLAVTLWRLATNIEYRTIAALFGLGISTVCTIVNRTCHVIATHLYPRYVRLPNEDELKEIIREFENLWGFPQVVGAIDGTHIPILKPQESASDYYNRKGFYSILVQAVVDSRGRFIDTNIGWPGKCHDSRVLVNSTFYERANRGQLLPDWKRHINGVDIPLLILGDPAYPLLPWLIKAYAETGSLSPQQRHFNYRQSRARMVVENSFGRLKGRWRCLLKRMDYYTITHTTDVIATCISLHNICEMSGDMCDPQWMLQEHTPITTSSPLLLTPTQNAKSICEALKDYLYNNQ